MIGPMAIIDNGEWKMEKWFGFLYQTENNKAAGHKKCALHMKQCLGRLKIHRGWFPPMGLLKTGVGPKQTLFYQ
jgi:hypothetical protein